VSKFDPFKKKKFDVEHALSIYATSFVVIPASHMYDEATISASANVLRSCHIYLIGLVPRVTLVDATQIDQELITTYEVSGSRRELRWDLAAGARLEATADYWFIQMSNGERTWIPESVAFRRLNDELDAVGFEVLYIGQAFGKDGTRNALDRLLKHETLQKISLLGFPATHSLQLLLLEIQPANRMITMFNPFAEDTAQGNARISAAIDKLFNTDESERITLYEASLIRYFQPKYNREFKDSFPSTNMKVLADCYEKDFNAIIAEICIDELPFKLFTEHVGQSQYHTVRHDLHDEEDRKIFFS
jgi:hypothetical protein